MTLLLPETFDSNRLIEMLDEIREREVEFEKLIKPLAPHTDSFNLALLEMLITSMRYSKAIIDNSPIKE